MKTFTLFFTFFFFLVLNISYAQIQQVNKLIPDDNGKLFGASMSIDGNYAVIGCPYDNTNGQLSGSVYIYDIAEKSQVKIIGSDVDADDLFGLSVAIDGQRVIIGAPHSGPYWEGAIYIFKRESNGAWIEDTTIKQFNYNEQFGCSVSISGSRLIVGTIEPLAYIYKQEEDHWLRDTIITIEDQNVSQIAKRVGINGSFAAIGDPLNSESGLDVGAVFIYEVVGDTVWTFRQKLLPMHSFATRDGFSTSLSFDNNLLVVGAPHHIALDPIQPSGAVYIFEQEGSSYQYITHMSKSKSLPNDLFGMAVDISNNFLLVGSAGTGEAFMFEKIGNNWVQLTDTLKAGDAFWTDQFGSSVCISGNYTLIGAPNHTGTATPNSGAAYLFSGFITSIEEGVAEIPAKIYLSQNYPNPFNPSTKIRYSIPQSNNVVIKVFNILGKEIETLVNEEKSVGTYELTWNIENLPSGVYFYQLKAGDFIQTKKMILLK